MKDMTLSGVAEMNSNVPLRPIRRFNHVLNAPDNLCPPNWDQNAHGTSPSSAENTIQALLQRTNIALNRIIEIRESLEPLVDFRQFQARTAERSRNHRRRHSATTDRSGTRIPSDRAHKSDTDLLQSCPEIFTHSNAQYLHTSLRSSTESFPIFARSFDSRDSADDATVSTEQSILDESDEMHFAQNDVKGNSSSEASDSDRGSSSSSTEGFDVEKERVRRLDHMQVAVYEELPEEFFQVLGRFLASTVEVRMRHSRFSFYKDAFSGAECMCQLIVNGFASDQPMAIRYGNVLMKLGLIEHVTHTDEQLHRDHFYRFSKHLHGSQHIERDHEAGSGQVIDACTQEQDQSSEEYNISEASDMAYSLLSDKVLRILQRVIHCVLERKNKLLYYKGYAGCFIAAEGVDLLQNLGIAGNLVDAILIKQALLDRNLIEPVSSNSRAFQNKCVFYHLTTLELDC
uniref:Uncharacterized protein AlNc14C104G6137 n=1 Tax=Albugo laibachii Nc14 TaxID=890382 RepID=F0WHT0_9STRA|nr:conserved hypothetical protein [Albugo laibachii Nc14]|eukprot:CCA20805.1 conserved hypothetical protein [Albugo laibachii Nc14]